MQYKIPVQIENEDPIVLWLSIRQLAIIIIGWWIWYLLFTSLWPSVWVEIALIPSISILVIAIMIATLKISEMTFVPFVLSFIRFKTNMENRKWIKWIDSFQAIDIWFVSSIQNKKEENIDFTDKIDKIKELDEKLNKI